MNSIRWTVTHARYDASVSLAGPTNKAERNHLRQCIRMAERGKIAGRNE